MVKPGDLDILSVLFVMIMEHKSSVYYFISWRSFYLFNLSTDHEGDHIIDKLEVKNFFEEFDLVRRLHGEKINAVNVIHYKLCTKHYTLYTTVKTCW